MMESLGGNDMARIGIVQVAAAALAVSLPLISALLDFLGTLL